MKFLKNTAVILFGLSIMLLASSAFAQAASSGLDLRAGLRIPIVRFGGMTFSDGEDSIEIKGGRGTLAGVGLGLSIGYRWTYFGIYLDQDIDGVWWTGDNAKIDDKGKFFAATTIMFRGLIPIQNIHLVDFGAGFGAVYSDKKGLFGTGVDGGSGLNIKVGLSYTYFFMDNLGAGISLDYAAGLKITDNSVAVFHSIVPMLSVRYIL